MQKFSSHGWMFGETYNALITSFAKHFELYSSKELSLFCAHLAESGLRQVDIFSAVTSKLVQFSKDTKRLYSNFGNVYLPLIRGAIELGI